MATVFGIVGLANAAIKAGAPLESSRAMSLAYMQWLRSKTAGSGERNTASVRHPIATNNVRVVTAPVDAGASLEAVCG